MSVECYHCLVSIRCFSLHWQQMIEMAIFKGNKTLRRFFEELISCINVNSVDRANFQMSLELTRLEVLIATSFVESITYVIRLHVQVHLVLPHNTGIYFSVEKQSTKNRLIPSYVQKWEIVLFYKRKKIVAPFLCVIYQYSNEWLLCWLCLRSIQYFFLLSTFWLLNIVNHL